jgi:hypothetical protein
MLQKLNHHIAACVDRAAECRRRAAQTTDPAIKAELLEMESRWTALVRSYEFVESLERFVLSAHQDRETRNRRNGVVAPDQSEAAQQS